MDVVISNHALEHVGSPLEIASKLLTKLKPGGSAVIVVPCERHDTKYKKGNIDRHLYTWSPLNLGNLFEAAGFDIVQVGRYAHTWPPNVKTIHKIFGPSVTQMLCVLVGHLRYRTTNIRLVARRSSA